MRATWPYSCRSFGSDARAGGRGASALGTLGDVQAIGPLIGALDDEAPRVRSSAVMNLCTLTGKAGVWGPTERKQLPAAVARWERWWTEEGKAKYGSKDAATHGR